jgi:hypothetical protein
MKFNFKRIVSVLTGAVMLSSTIGFAAAAWPDPFVKSGVGDAAVVYGGGASVAATDVTAAQKVSTELGKSLIGTAVTPTSGSTTAAALVGEGDKVALATSSLKMYYGSALDSTKTTIASTDMPNVLKSSSVVDDTGNTYTYQQTIAMGNRTIAYSTSSSDLTDPELIIDAGYNVNLPLYTYKLSFNKNINVTSTDVQGNDITILGKKFTIGANSDAAASSPVLYLYGSGDSATINEGDEKTVNVGGKSHTLKLASVTQKSSLNYITVSVDGGTTREIREGTVSKVGGLEVYAKTVTYNSKTGTISSASVNVGGEVLKLTNGANVQTGAELVNVDGTSATLSETGGLLREIQIKVTTTGSTKDYIKAGSTFNDPVFGGLKLTFKDITPALNDSTRESFVVDTDNARHARVTFTSALQTEPKQITFFHDQDTEDTTITNAIADGANKTIHLVEGERVYEGEYAIINAGDYGRIVKVTGLPSSAITAYTTKIRILDALDNTDLVGTSDSPGIALNGSGYATTTINEPYYFNVVNDSSRPYVQIYWGTGAGNNAAGSVTTLFPRIKLKNGAWFSILAPTYVDNATSYSVPGKETIAGYETAVSMPANMSAVTSVKVGNVNYTFTPFSSMNNGTLWGIDPDGSGANGVGCNFTYGGILYQEEKKLTETSNSEGGDIICIPLDTTGTTTPVEISVGQPTVSGTWSDLQTWGSKDTVRGAYNKYGTFVKFDTADNDKVELSYPTDQMIANILLTAETVSITSSGGTTATGETGTILFVKDNEVDKYTNKNLIVVGGSCINTVAARLLGSTTPVCEAAFTTKTTVGAGKYLIETFDSPYVTNNTKKIATLVAGYNAADTVAAVDAFLLGKTNVSVGAKTVTEAKAVVTAGAAA